MTREILAFDLGAESGRAVLGRLRGGKLELEEAHRFPNEPQEILGRLYWDTSRLFAEIKNGLIRAVREKGARPASIGVDTWGVDFALLDQNDELLGLPYHYRDHRTDGIMERTFAIVPREEIYRATGIQFMQLNTLFQLMALRFDNSPLLDSARSLLFTPDLLHFWLTGRKANELSIASTSQFYDPASRTFATTLLDRLGIPRHFLQEIVEPGTELASLHESVGREAGVQNVRVITPASHDTGSAVAAVPAESAGRWAYISCGTWSLVGVESPRPVISDRTLEYNLTNEGGVNGTTRLLRNVMGLWLLQQCRRSWERAGRRYAYDELAAMAAEAPPFGAFVDPDDESFLNPPDMPEAIAAYCRRSGQTPPDGVAATVRCITESLALKYRWVIEKLEDITGARVEVIHVMGGGCRNRQLCQATADATGRTVLAGPVEATAAGNIIVQAIALGQLASLQDARALIRRSFPQEESRPSQTAAWDSAYQRFLLFLRS